MPETLFAAIDNYCERTGPEFWSEPLNALTNLSFIAAGIWGLRAARAAKAGGFAEILAWWAIAIGIGSFLFHTFANEITKWADVLPIAIFTLVYTVFALRRYLGYGAAATAAIFVGFYALAFAVTAAVPDGLRIATAGSTGYLPAFLALAVFGAWCQAAGHPAGRYLIGAAATFLVSVTFRILDPKICESFPLGTHFLWHILNGLLVGILLAAAARYGRVKTAGRD